MRKLQEIHNDYVVVGADKAENNVIVVCKKYYLSRVIKELDLDNIDIRKDTENRKDDSNRGKKPTKLMSIEELISKK